METIAQSEASLKNQLHDIELKLGILKKDLRNEEDMLFSRKLEEQVNLLLSRRTEVQATLQRLSEQASKKPKLAESPDAAQSILPVNINLVASGVADPLTRYGFKRIDRNTGEALPPYAGKVLLMRNAPRTVDCSFCKRCFSNQGALASHIPHCHTRNITQTLALNEGSRATLKTSGRSVPKEPNWAQMYTEADRRREETVQKEAAARVPKKRGGASVRKRYRSSFKLHCIRILDSVVRQIGKARGAQAIAAQLCGIHESMICRWARDKAKWQRLELKAAGSKGAGNVGRVLLSSSSGPKPYFEAAEKIVLAKVDQTRFRRCPVTARMMKRWMKTAVEEIEKASGSASPFKKQFVASNSWLAGFTRRHGLAIRRATNKKEVSIQERLPAIQNFHSKLQGYISAPPEATHSDDPIFGRYTAANCFNMDQSPLFLDATSNETYDKRGAITVGVAKRKGSDQRFATLTICVRLDGCADAPVKQPPIGIIFRGTGQRISREERDMYAEDVFVDFQPKAWTDSETLQRWSDMFVGWTKENCDDRQKLLFLDNLKAQTMDGFRDRLAEGNVKAWWLPKNCTDLVQPVDRHLAKQLKSKVKFLLDEYLAEHPDFQAKWHSVSADNLKAKDVRIFLTKVVSKAWKLLCLERDFLCLGLQTGCVMPKVGVDRAAMQLQPITITGLGDVYRVPEPIVNSGPSASAFEPSSGLEEEEGNQELGSADEASITNLVDGEPELNARKSKGLSRSRKVISASESDESDVSDDGEGSDVPSDDEVASAINPFEEEIDDDCEVESDDELISDRMNDSTRAFEEPIHFEAPEGFAVEPSQIVQNLNLSSLVGRRILWRIPSDADGKPAYIVAEIASGPPDPAAMRRGITFQLRCNKTIDRRTPPYMCHKHSLQSVSLGKETYEREWLLLKRI